MVEFDDFRYYTEWHNHVNQTTYEAPPVPWRLVPVDPTGVERLTVVDLRYGLGQVRGGEWDRPESCRDLAELTMYDGLRQRFVEGQEWTETDYYDWVRERFDTEHGFRGKTDFDEHGEAWFDHVDDLYESIADGYRTNRGTVYDDPADIEYVHEMEPLALVGRDGEVIWTEGFHRLILSRVAGVDRVPVYVLWRHEEWQATRDAVARDPEDVNVSLDHPDLADVEGGVDAGVAQ